MTEKHGASLKLAQGLRIAAYSSVSRFSSLATQFVAKARDFYLHDVDPNSLK